ncbi:hypothetical protein QL285_029018 [Trifolium repens]|nr:hypothetical protein QL285_029018 [Trifolium repens]
MEHLKCKLLSGTLNDAILIWYMNFSNNVIAIYANFQRKFIHQFASTKHINVTVTSLYNICPNQLELLHEYPARFNEATIQVLNPNHKMFVDIFHNGLKTGHFKESLARKSATLMQEIIKRVECYIKKEESNAEKRSKDAKETLTRKYHRSETTDVTSKGAHAENK